MSADNTRLLTHGLGAFSLALGAAQLAAPGVLTRLIGADDNARNRFRQRWIGGAREFGVGVGIESGYLSAAWLWSRVAGDAFDLGVLGSLLAGKRRRAARRRAALSTVAVAGVTALDIVAATSHTRQGS